MTVGFVMLCHEALNRAAQVARHWAERDCPVVIHVDRRVADKRFDRLVAAMSGYPNVTFSERRRCEWGTWSLVEATQLAVDKMLHQFPEVRHVYLASGSCLPLRPVEELKAYLDRHHDVDFIESVTTEDVPWTVGGLDAERFTLRFPFSWKRRRRLFDTYVRLQRRVGFRRRIPPGLEPHMGSQWWCLTRRTLTRIQDSPERAAHERYFRRVWIPDESYYQTLVRQHSERIESRSLTLSKFDFQGKPHVFYDDHLQLLHRSDCFVARKIWPWSDRLYDVFLKGGDGMARRAEPNPGKIDRIFAKAVERRTRGRSGLYMQSRFPNRGWENGVTCAPYSVLHGFGDLIEDFPTWLHRATDCRVHGHLFGPDRAEFADGQRVYTGALSDSVDLRDYNPEAFLTSLLWNTRGERQSFLYGPRDTGGILSLMVADPNAQISVVSGAWAVPLFRSAQDFAAVRREAARLQKIESAQLALLRSGQTKARVRIWSMADFVEAPMEPLQSIIDEIGTRAARNVSEAPTMVDLTGFGQFLQNLKNEGMQPHLMGDFPVNPNYDPAPAEPRRRPYLMR
ncbi:Core-2/I-Branching enzyme [Tranquillimonas rosea]|uniref:Peptide O-xylosyltransferase n=1 Tax=Tranquillimonas rosea TaxID=641238 RepID=A0A1H9UJ07_9RHOB|nr:beta-1,6-N-acetylglucosaminyltransferase [Tranquillimonas rosea]SES09445.1 Core-2/I-Branching enzyme [Tranquillimonas rosea]